MSVEILLTGQAAAQAQTLVAALLAEGIEVEPLADTSSEENRDLQSLAVDVGVGLLVEVTVTVLRHVVDTWRRQRDVRAGEIELRERDAVAGKDEATESDGDPDENDADGPR